VVAARETCHALGLPHVTVDLRASFRREVVDPFVEEYAAGRTPNPCMRCNGRFRFDELVAFSRRAGADVLWTGHYARIVERDGVRLVARGIDPAKDQSYMLATVEPAVLDRVGFPLGAETKDAVRAEDAPGLAAADAQVPEACFLGGDDTAFLERQGVALDGPVVDWTATRSALGLSNAGSGIGVAAPGTRRPARNADRGAPLRAVTRVEVWHAADPADRVEAKLRYRSPGCRTA
jgi:tRNA-specific 2-thiouridylase